MKLKYLGSTFYTFTLPYFPPPPVDHSYENWLKIAKLFTRSYFFF